ncbi:MAG: tRNA pseudouridine(38-40) synthase TruA [Coprobacillus sp.]|nr:tRNA pseudouridine(38-40) synthase TruA [Coprobacillus sp.]
MGVVSYKGTHYSGWAKQPNESSIQEEIEKVLSQLYDEKISIYGSGRTDRGVHALGQTFHYDASGKKSLQKIKISANLMLNDEINIISLKYVNDDFHARYSATSKEYEYKFELASKDPLNCDLVYVCPYHLDIKLMKEAASLFVGTHNFMNFTSKEEDENNFIRTITSIKFSEKDGIYTIHFKGDGFMRYMIRYLVGTLIEVARGKIPLSFIKERLDSDGERCIISYKAQPQGLYLKKVCYYR